MKPLANHLVLWFNYYMSTPQADTTTATWDSNEHRRAARQAKAERIVEFLIAHGRDLLGVDDTPESLYRLADALGLASTRREPHDDALWESLGQFAACKTKPSHVTQAMVVARLRARAEAAARPFADLPV